MLQFHADRGLVKSMSKDISSLRMERLNNLVWILKDGRGYSKSDLMERFEYTNPRTLERDLELLRCRFGVDIKNKGSRHLYRCYDTGQFLLRLSLSEKEVTALIAGLRMAEHFLPHLHEEAETLWSKIGHMLPHDLLDHGEALSSATVVSLPVSSLDPSIFQKLIDAIKNQKTLKIKYSSPYQNNEVKERTIFPWGVYFQSHAWYLWAGSPEHEDGATWRISRVLSCEEINTEWKSSPGGQTVEDYAGSAWFARPGKLQYKIKLHLFMPLASIVAETKWHPTQKIQQKEDGSIILTATVPDLEEVARWAMSCAPHIEVLEPVELSERLVEFGRIVAAKHNLK